jgi:hypothetical protein
MKFGIKLLTLLIFILAHSARDAEAQTRDYFTPAEVELIRNAQEIDLRINVLIKAIDRRFTGLQIGAAAPKVSGKDADKWGPLPTGTRAELLLDVKKILQKAIDDIDNLAERPDSAPIPLDEREKRKPASELFPKAVRNLAEAAKRYEPTLKAELETTKDGRESAIISESIDMCEEIIAAVPKLPAQVEKKKNKDRY